MNYPSSYFKKAHQNPIPSTLKAQQNKPNTINIKKNNYQQDQQTYTIKTSDSTQVKAMKQKLRIVMQKLSTARKQKQQAIKQNLLLQKQIINLRTNQRHMIPGFNNTSSTFPMQNQIIAKLLQFYKYECLDRFFQTLCPQQLSMKGVIYFYHYSFEQVTKMVEEYFAGALEGVREVGCFENIEGPIMNVLRKSFQTTYEKILRKIIEKHQIPGIATILIEKLCLESQEKQVLQQTLTSFLQTLLQLCLFCKISDPPLIIQTQSIGKKIKYNSIFNDPLDGFIKNKQQCWVVLPEIRKSENQEIVVKSLVLRTDYFDGQEGDDGEGEGKE